MHGWLGYCELYFVVILLVCLFIPSCMMVNDINISTLKTFTGFVYTFNAWLSVSSINHIDLLSSDVQHNNECHFVAVEPRNGKVFNYTNSKSNNNYPISIIIDGIIAHNQSN